MYGLSPQQFALVLIVAAIPILPNLWSIWHVFNRNFSSPVEKLSWIGLAVFIPVIGGIVYIIWGRKRGRKMQ